MDRANDVKAAFGDGVNNTDAIAYTVATGAGSGTGRVDPVPVGWYGEFVEIISVGADSRFYFTFLISATIDPGIAPSGVGSQSAQRGELAQANIAKQVLVPVAGPGTTVFLARASTGAPTSFEMVKRSGKPGNNLNRDS
jgi:hypothetical protein